MLRTLLCIALLTCSGEYSVASVRLEKAWSREPSFIVPARNVTVVAGRKAILPCSVEYLGRYKMAWANQRHTLLSLEDRRIIDDDRFMVVRDIPGEWNLHILDVKPSDEGQYTCQINTSPVKINKVNLYVLVPPKLHAELSSNDVIAKEGDTVILKCNVSGTPHPNVTWYRRSMGGKNSKERIGVVGEVLMIYNISRYCNDVYECVADNGVANPVSRLMRVTVYFAPEIYMPTKRIGQALGKETILECKVTAMPQGISLWKRNGTEIRSSWKYRVDAYADEEYTVTLSLRIRSIDKEDYREYTCVASNHLGNDEESMILFDIAERIITTTTTTTTTMVVESVFPQHTRKNGYTIFISQRNTSNGQTTPAVVGPHTGGSSKEKDNLGCRISSNILNVLPPLLLLCISL